MQFLSGADIKNYLSTKCRLQSWRCIKESKYMYHCNVCYIVISNWLSVMLNLKSFFKERMLLADSCTPGALAHVNIQFQNRVGRCSNRAVQLTSKWFSFMSNFISWGSGKNKNKQIISQQRFSSEPTTKSKIINEMHFTFISLQCFFFFICPF